VVEIVRVVGAIIWALDDGRRPPLEIQREALALLCETPADINARIARCSAALEENVAIGREVAVKVANELLRRMAPGAVAWWKSVAPPPRWLPSAPALSASALWKALRINWLKD